MDTTLLYILIWLAVGLLGISIDQIKNGKHDRQGLSTFKYSIWVGIFVLGGLITFGTVMAILIENESNQ